jgi:hypothetical protein
MPWEIAGNGHDRFGHRVATDKLEGRTGEHDRNVVVLPREIDAAVGGDRRGAESAGGVVNPLAPGHRTGVGAH